MRYSILLFLILAYGSIKSQTLYWVGGSGNFNDAAHWSLVSGGPAANIVPNSSNDVVFDDNSGIDNTLINIVGTSRVRSFYTKNQYKKINLTGSNVSELVVGGDFILNPIFFPRLESKLNFSSIRPQQNRVTFSGHLLYSDVEFNNGAYDLQAIKVDKTNSIKLNQGKFFIDHSSLSAGNIYANKNAVEFKYNSAIINAYNALELGEKTILTGKDLKIIANKNDENLFKIHPNVILNPLTEIIQQNALVCTITYSFTNASCNNACDASITITFSDCVSSPTYNLIFNTGATCLPPGANNIAPPTYTLAAICASACAGQLVDILVFDGVGFVTGLFGQSLPQNPTPIQASFTNSLAPTCAGLCNGSVTMNYFGGAQPYDIFVVSAVPVQTIINLPPFTNTVVTGLCPGVQTFSVVDNNGCIRTFTNVNIPAQTPIVSNSVVNNVACANVPCTGSFSVSPSGGAAGNYTVAFTPGGTFTTAPGGTVGVGALCAGTSISALITGVNGCTASTGTVTITQPPAVTITPSQTNVACFGGSTGSASVTVSGGVGPYNYTWTPGPGTNSPGISGLPIGTQTVTISNNGVLCSNTFTFNITGPNAFTITPTITHAPCNGGVGSASLVITAGSGNGAPYGFTWSPVPPVGQGTGTISNLTPGSYTATISDNSPAPGCFTTAVITITAPPAYTVSAIISTITCFGQCTGAASLSVSGNVSPYSFVWSPTISVGQGAGTGTISSLCVGNYTANITGPGAICPTTAVVAITQPPTVIANVVTTSVTCNNACNGSINSAPSGGNGAPYSFTLVTPVPSTIVAAPPFNGLCAGTYTLFIGSGGCVQSFTPTIAQPNPLIPSVVMTSVTCFNACNGSLAGSVIGGEPTYTLSWTTPTTSLPGGAIANQCAGTYTFNVTDANGCFTTQVVTLVQPTQITATINPTNPSCNGGNNGILSAIVVGGSPGYTLNWSNGFIGNPNSGLFAGNYTLTVTDVNNCSRAFTIALTQPAAIAITQTITNPVCSGSCNATATISASGGTPSYTYQSNIPPLTTNTTGIFTGLCAGNYNVSITDANGCSQPAVFTVTNPPVLSVPVTSILTSCNACTGGATVAPAGGTPTYAVVWTNSLAVVVATNAAASGLCPGNHTATVTDAAGCTATAGVNIVLTVSVTVNIAGSGIQCFNVCTGSAVATPTGGVGLYSYTWTPTLQSAQTATGLCSGTHTVVVADQNGCSNTGTINFANPPDIIIASSQTNVACNGVCSGAISTTVTGGTGTLALLWSPGAQTTPSISNLCGGPPAGTYTLNVTDQNNCPKSQTFTITQNPAITATFAVSNPNACGANNGSICASVSGGVGAYTYSWTPAVGAASCITGLGAGAYSVVITDTGPCTVTLATSLTNPTGPTLTINSQSVNCFGGNTGGATVVASGVGPAYTFTWSPVVSFTNTPTTSTVSGLLSGTYNIAVTGSNNCVTSQSINIAGAPQLTVTSVATNPKCFTGPCNGSITLVTSGGTAPYTGFSWLPAAPPITGQGTQTVTGLCGGSYTVNITDNNSCVQSRTFTLVTPPAITLTATPTNVQCFGFCNGSILANATGGTGLFSYNWPAILPSFGGSITATVNGLCPNTYTVIATDANTCIATGTILITQPTALTNTFSSSNSSCSGSCNATASNTVSGGTPTYTYSWSGSPLTTPTIGNLCPGNYSATITDGNGCTVVTPFTVTAPAPITVTLTPSNPLCNAACNGSITAALTGAQGTVNFAWSPVGPNSATNSPLCSGNYTLIVTDANSCQVNAVTTLTNPPALLANVTTTNPSCNGVCNGVAISNPANNVGLVNFTWTPAAPNSPTNSALCGGPPGVSYTLSISDQNGCTDVQTFTLTNPPAATINPAVTPASCSFSNGGITIVVAGGTPTFAFVWTPAVAGNTNVAVNLPAGIYSVNITDANGCTNTVSIPLSNANGPSLTPVSVTSLNCNNIPTGGATVNVGGISGGTPNYTVTWLVPPAPSSVNPLSNLPAGTYTAQTIDANACIFFTAVTISEPAPIVITPNFTLPTCNGICNGIVTLNTSGGTPGYNYTWTPLGPNNSATLTSACAGNYTIGITDNLGCPSTQTVNLPATLNMTAVFNNLTNPCSNSCIASSTITPSGGAVTMSVSWSNGQVGNTAVNLCAGIYTAMVTDANSCFNTFTTTITSPPALSATTGITAPACNLCNGTATAGAIGGTGPAYTYSWSSGAIGTVASSLCAGLYQVLITDQNLCTQIQNVLISNVPGITGETFSLQNVTCAGNCNGGATVTPIGGAPVITYSWIAPSSTLSSINGLCAGNYFVQMTDANGCIRTASTSINAAAALTIAPFVTQPSCGNSNGIIQIVPSGGAPGYTISWGPPLAPNSSTMVSGLAAGIYTVTVTDQAPCSQTQVFTLSNSNAPVITFTQTNINCFNGNTGSIIAIGTSTAAPITYSWSTGSTSQTVTGLSPGIITLTVSAGGCFAFQTFTLTDNPAMKLSLSNVLQPNCNNDCNGAITLIPSGGTLPYTFSWSPGAITANPATSLCAGPGVSTTYSATVTDIRGCSTTETITLLNPALLVVTNTLNNSSCSTASDGSATLSLSGGTPTYNISWTGPNSFTASTQTITNVLAGTYTFVVTDSRNCGRTDSLKIVPTITIIANAVPDVSICPNNTVVLNGTTSIGANAFNWYQVQTPTVALGNTSTISVSPASGTFSYVLEAISSVSTCLDSEMVLVTVYPSPFVDAGPSFTIPLFSTVTIGGSPSSPTGVSYTWSPPFTLDNSFISNPIASNTVNTTYTLTVTDANGCTASDTISVFLYPEIKIPNGFSPNGDNKNDRWVIDNMDQFTENVVEVYNRWGELLFRKIGYLDHFDGKFNNKDLPVGTYYYIIILNHPAYPTPYTGPLTIFR